MDKRLIKRFAMQQAKTVIITCHDIINIYETIAKQILYFVPSIFNGEYNITNILDLKKTKYKK